MGVVSNRCAAQISKLKVEELDKALEVEYERQERAKQVFLDAQEELSAAQEEIDMDSLPEGAQPVKRIQR